jgi:hypothetical protein
MEDQKPTSSRPTFLTVICIISFVGLGLSVLNNFMSLMMSTVGSWIYSTVQESLEMAYSQATSSNPNAAAFLQSIFDGILKMIEVLPLFSGLILLFTSIALSGVVFMWNLKKLGFYIYLVAKIVMIFLPIALIGYNFISVFISLFSFIGTALFVTLYGLNLKAMK